MTSYCITKGFASSVMAATRHASDIHFDAAFFVVTTTLYFAFAFTACAREPSELGVLFLLIAATTTA